LRLGCRVVRLGIAELIAGSDTDAGDVDVARRLDALVAIATIEVAIAASEHSATEQDCAYHHRSYCRSSHRVVSAHEVHVMPSKIGAKDAAQYGGIAQTISKGKHRVRTIPPARNAQSD